MITCNPTIHFLPGKLRHQRTLLVVKLTSALLIICCMHTYAAGERQDISIKLNNEPITKFFQDIEKQTKYKFVFAADDLKWATPVTIELRHVSLEQALEQCFRNQPLTYKIISDNIVIRLKNRPQASAPSAANDPIDIKGKVISEKGEPIEGITVYVAEIEKYTTTDQTGYFFLGGVDSKSKLIFTGINIDRLELNVNNQRELLVTVRLKIVGLEDVTVTYNSGYQDIPKERATGSFVRLDNKTINQQAGFNILKRLDGVSSGVLFDTKDTEGGRKSLNINIRGINSINGPLDPLIVLDGFIYEGDIDNINPNMIESITILKDAAAASIWGARAGNGVIIINTKKGKYNQKLQVEVSANVTVNSKPDLYYLPQMKSGDYIDVEQMLFNNGKYNDQIDFSPYLALSPAAEVFLQRRQSLISATDSANRINALKSVDSRDQYNRYFYTHAVLQQYSAGFRGGSNNHSYSFLLGYDRSLGERFNKYDRLNVKLENIFRPIRNLQFTAGIYFTNSNGTSGRPGYTRQSKPYLQIADEQGNSMPVPLTYRDHYTDSLGTGGLLDWKYYLLDEYKYSTNQRKTQEIFVNTGLQYKIKSYLSLNVGYQYQRQQANTEQLSTLESYAARDAINSFAQIDPSTGAVTFIVPKGGIRRLATLTTESQTLRGQVNVDKNWQAHSINAIIGAELRDRADKGTDITSYGYTADPLSYVNVDLVNAYPHLLTGNYQNIGIPPDFSSTHARFVSLYGNASYTLQGRYILSASARRDGSNVFGVKTNDRWKPLWSVGMAWKIDREPFFTNSIFSLLTLRTTYGKTGNVSLNKAALPIAIFTGSDLLTNYPSAVIDNINNPSLKWEETGQWNIGLDFTIANQVISGTIDYYEKKGKDLYGPAAYDYTTWGGGSIVERNVAAMEGKGLDVQLNSKNFDKTFKWTTSLLLNYNKSITTKYYSTQTSADIQRVIGSGGSIISPVVGKPLYAIAAYKWGGLNEAGLAQGYVNGEKSIDYSAIMLEAAEKGEEGNVVYVGPATPTVFGSLVNTFSWKNFSISANIAYKLGYYFRKSTISYKSLVNLGAGHADFAKRWQKVGDEQVTNVPVFDYTLAHDDNASPFFTGAEVNVLRGDHFRLQYINLTYTLSGKQLFKIPYNSIQFYAYARDLGILWRANKENIDPEFSDALPPVKSFTAGVRISF